MIRKGMPAGGAAGWIAWKTKAAGLGFSAVARPWQAFDAAALGRLARWRLIPVGTNKVPLIRRWPERAVPASDRATIRSWLARWPHAALALVTGPESGVLVLDVDTATGHGADGAAALADLERRLGRLPPTAEAATPTGGRHLFFRWPVDVARIPSKPLAPGLDVKASGGCVTLPTGRRTPGRRWIRHPHEGLAELPARWRARLLPPPPRLRTSRPAWDAAAGDGRYVAAALASAVERVVSAAVGTRHVTLFREAASLARLIDRGLDPQAAARALVDAATRAGLPVAEARRTVADAFRRGPGGPGRARFAQSACPVIERIGR